MVCILALLLRCCDRKGTARVSWVSGAASRSSLAGIGRSVPILPTHFLQSEIRLLPLLQVALAVALRYACLTGELRLEENGKKLQVNCAELLLQQTMTRRRSSRSRGLRHQWPLLKTCIDKGCCPVQFSKCKLSHTLIMSGPHPIHAALVPFAPLHPNKACKQSRNHWLKSETRTPSSEDAGPNCNTSRYLSCATKEPLQETNNDACQDHCVCPPATKLP